MNWIRIIELPLREFALAHYREALRLSGVKSRAEVAKCLREDFPDGGLSDYLKKLNAHSLGEIGLFFFYIGSLRAGKIKSLRQIHETYNLNFADVAYYGKLTTRDRYYYILKKSFNPIVEQMQTKSVSDEWRVYLDLCMGREQMAA